MKLAKDEGISLETADAARYQDQRDAEARLRSLEGAVFDQAYIVEMVRHGGTRNVKMVDTILTLTQDPEVKAYFVAFQPIVRAGHWAKQLRTTPRGTE